MYERLEFWKTKGMNPSVVYDIGAHNGSWTKGIQPLFPDAKFIAFEPNREHQELLQDISSHFILLGNKSEIVPYYTNAIGCTSGNSIYLEKTIYFNPQTAFIQMLPLVRLDEYIQKQNLPIPDFIKLDVQGAELDVLQGLGDYLKSVKYIVAETSLHRYNEGAPLIEDIITFLKNESFEIIDFVELHKINGYLAQVDILFAHTSTQLRKKDFYDGHLNFS